MARRYVRPSNKTHLEDAYHRAAVAYDNAIMSLMRKLDINPNHTLSAEKWKALNTHPSVEPLYLKQKEAYRRLVGR
jgi:hypothetical protein